MSMSINDDTTPLIPDRRDGEDSDQSYSTFHTKRSLVSETEESPSFTDDSSLDDVSTKSTSGLFKGSVASIIVVLLLGEFISNADSTIVMATAGPISSQFNQLQSASWLATAFALGVGSVQLIYGKLSIIYGRKPILLLSYFLLALGCVICGLSPSMSSIIVGRVISGMGGSGIMAMGSIIILDVVPKRDVAGWRAIVNISMTLGRSIGGPIGGWLTDTIGWRWVFLTQAPLLGIAAILVIIFLQFSPNNTNLNKTNSESNPTSTSPSPTTGTAGKPSLRRVDITGCLLLATSVITLTLLIDRGGKAFPWSSQNTLILASTSLTFLIAFTYHETHLAPEPIFDLAILRLPNVSTCYLIGLLQISAQSSMMYTVPLYFQVTANVPAAVAGTHLVPSVVGNAIGGLIAGWFIRRTGYYKPVLFIAGLIASISYLLLFLRWKGDNNTSVWESLFIVPGGMGTAFASAASFVALTAFLGPDEVIMVTGGYMLVFSFAMTAGVTTTNSVLTSTFKANMMRDLRVDNSEEIIRHSLANSHYISELTGEVRDIVVKSYVGGLRATYLMSLVLSLAGSALGLTVHNHRL